MRKYILRKEIEDETEAPTHFEAFVKFRDRCNSGYYNIRQEDVEDAGEVEETPTSTPEELKE